MHEQIRQAELDEALPYIGRPARLLEIGGANGLQASLISRSGIRVMSIDLPSRRREEQHHLVVDYDGCRIPARTGTFDRIFSSNVLEHVRDLPLLFAEMHRVLRRGGYAVHLMPSVPWRFWTSASHYPFLIKRLLGLRHEIPGVGQGPSVGDAFKKRGVVGTAARVLLPGPHGEYPNAIAELHFFSERRWIRTFRQNGFDVVQTAETNIFYTGYGLSNLALSTRRRLARVLGSATRIYVTRPQ